MSELRMHPNIQPFLYLTVQLSSLPEQSYLDQNKIGSVFTFDLS